MKQILGLDIGTNSIGWAVVRIGEFSKEGEIAGLGSRIIPMDGDAMQKFESGIAASKNADRRMARTARRLKQRFKLRRTRLIQVCKILEWMPANFPSDFRSASGDSFSMSQYLPFHPSTIEEAKKTIGLSAIPEDWIIYYLRSKALTEKISLHELARIIYMMNQRRGFKSSRKNSNATEDENELKYPLTEKWVQILSIDDINEISEERGTKLLEVTAGEIKGQIKRRSIPDWKGKEMELEITKRTVKSGEVTYTFSTPDPNDWEKKKVALEQNIHDSGYHVGAYFLQQIIENKTYRIRQRIVDRSLYKAEFEAIWKKQASFHPGLTAKKKLKDIAQVLYKNNTQKQKEITGNDLYHLFCEDIIYYQRPLRSQRHKIDRCKLEYKYDADGNQYGIPVAPKSCPEFQEFRIWQTIHNLRVLELEGDADGKTQIDIDQSAQYLNNGSKARLFDLFDSRAAVSHTAILKELGLSHKQFRLNYPSDKEFLGNETKNIFRRVFNKHKAGAEGEALLNDSTKFYQLWHILYSLEDISGIVSALLNPAKSFNLSQEVVAHLSKLPDLPKQYAAYSSKAIKKMLPLMRCGRHFEAKNIHPLILDRIHKIIREEYDEVITEETRDRIAALNMIDVQIFQGLPTWLVNYIIYGKHAERENGSKYNEAGEINIPLLIPNNSLRNPVVEQILKECLSLVKDIWQQYGQPDEIHIELARELKKTAEERKNIDSRNKDNEADRKRIRAILKELEYSNPDSPSDIERYRLWGEQDHISPYTGKVIPLSKLFTAEYEIEHIIPRSRFFDNSFLNKTICETCVNDFKGNRLARQLIETDGGRTITHKGSTFTLLDPDGYLSHCKRIFKGGKYRNLLREEVPADFITRQINDTRQITRRLAELLYPVAKDKEGIVFTIGAITNELKDKWGLNRVWKDILKPRFERLELLTGESLIDYDNAHNNIHFKKDYKRVDHRHHALDALVIAGTTREHIRYLNTLNAGAESGKYRYLVKRRFSDFVLPWETFTKEAKEKLKEVIVSHKNRNRLVSKAVNKYTKWVELPDGKWVKQLLPQVKGQLLSIRKSMFKEPMGKITLREYRDVNLKEALKVQLEAVRTDNRFPAQIADSDLRTQVKSIIKNSGFDLKEVEKFLKANPLVDKEGNKRSKVRIMEYKEYAAKRVALDSSFTLDKINKIPYATHATLAKLLRQHLEMYNGDPKIAFKGEALEDLYRKAGKQIHKVTIYEEIGKKIALNGKLVEGDKGTNLFFVIYENVITRKRIIKDDSSVPLMEAIVSLANKWPIASEKPEHRTIVLSPNDLVYVPEEGADVDLGNLPYACNRIYKVVSFSKAQCFFIPHFVSKPLDDAGKELGSNNKSERSWDGQTIKNVCIKIKVDRLGNIAASHKNERGMPVLTKSALV